MAERDDLLAAEQSRLEHLVASNYAKLAELLTDDLIHVHASGSVDGKTSFLATIEAQLEFMEMDRGDLEVRIYGDVAVVTGPLKQTVRIKATDEIVVVEIFTTQVWRRQSGSWLMSNFHATRTAAH